MPHVQEAQAVSGKAEPPVAPSWRPLVPLACTASFALYLAFSHGLRFLFSGWEYYAKLVKMAFPTGIPAGLTQHIPAIPIIPTTLNGLLLLGFLATCVASGWLAHLLLRGRRTELGPHLILFSLPTAIVPTLLLAMFFWPDGRGLLTLELTVCASLLIVLVLAGLKLTLFPSQAPLEPDPAPEYREPLGWAWAFSPSLIVMFSFVYLRGYVSYGGYDALFYHLPLAASWFHNARITKCFDIQCDYPSNSELLMRWGFIDGSERFVFLVPFLSAILCIYMIYKLGRVIGQGRQPAFVAACCAATFPVIPFLATTAYTDIPGVLFLLLSVFFLIRWKQSELMADKDLFCAGLAAGLAVGTKMSMIPPAFAIVLVTMVALLRAQQMWRLMGPRAEDVALNWTWLLTRAGGFFSSALLGGGYWYFRNLMEHGNPFYPVAVLGFPGSKIKEIVQMHPAFAGSPWLRLLYPWTELTYGYPFDDGIGAVAAGIAIPALLLWPFLRNRKKSTLLVGPGVIFSIASISLLLFFWSDNMMMRMGIFAILICFVLVGELWKSVPSLWLKAVTFAAFLIMTAAITHGLAGGYLYEYLRNNQTRAERLHVPAAVDSISSTRIFNAAASFHNYGLMGRDYRHEVVTLFREVKPEDVIAYRATHVLLTKAQVDSYRAKLSLEQVGTETTGADPVSLWRIVDEPTEGGQ